jgi:hypothetical protein
MMIWGERDPIIPVAHGRAAHDLVPGSRLEVFPDAGHFPHLDDPIRFVRVMIDFFETPRQHKSMPGAGASYYAAAPPSPTSRPNARPRLVDPRTPQRRPAGRAVNMDNRR